MHFTEPGAKLFAPARAGFDPSNAIRKPRPSILAAIPKTPTHRASRFGFGSPAHQNFGQRPQAASSATAAPTAVTNASGQASFTITDAPSAAAKLAAYTTDAFTFTATGGTTVTAGTITWSATGPVVGTVTILGGDNGTTTPGGGVRGEVHPRRGLRGYILIVRKRSEQLERSKPRSQGAGGILV